MSVSKESEALVVLFTFKWVWDMDMVDIKSDFMEVNSEEPTGAVEADLVDPIPNAGMGMGMGIDIGIGIGIGMDVDVVAIFFFGWVPIAFVNLISFSSILLVSSLSRVRNLSLLPSLNSLMIGS